jgi:beta-phosphoglucomutase-like phosphatase (HAD superfamily)
MNPIFSCMRGLPWNTLENTYVFEDIYLAIQTAKRAGFGVIAVYDKTSARHSEEIAAIADRYIQPLRGWMPFFKD